MNPIPSPTPNNDKTDLLIAAVRHATTPELLESSAADYFGEAIVGPIFNAASLPASALEEQKESDSLEPLDNPKGRTIKDLIRLLVADRTVNVEATDSTYWPLLFFAVQNLTVLKMLFEHRPELTESFSTIAAREPNKPNSIIWDAFTWADSKGCVESLVFLANKLAEPAATAKKREIIRRFLTKDLTQPSNQENFLAVLNAFALPANEMNDFLLEAVNANAPLAIQTLLKAPNSDVNAVDDDGYTALMWAAKTGKHQCINQLLKAPDINVNAQDHSGWTALIWAVACNDKRCVSELVTAREIDVNARTGSYDTTVLIMAAEYNQAEIIATLLTASDIDVNAHDIFGVTALMEAASKGHAAAIRKLLNADNIEINARASDGSTALMWAGSEGHLEAYEALLAGSASPLRFSQRAVKLAPEAQNRSESFFAKVRPNKL